MDLPGLGPGEHHLAVDPLGSGSRGGFRRDIHGHEHPAFQAECQDCTGYGFLRLISGIVILLITPGGTYFMEKRLEYLDRPEGEQ